MPPNISSVPTNIGPINIEHHVAADRAKAGMGPPMQSPSMAKPEGLAPRTSAAADAAPRAPLAALSTGDASQLATKLGSEVNKATTNDGNEAMHNVLEANMQNMKFQATMGVVAMQKGMIEAIAKTTKDIGTKVAQLAG